MCGLNEGEEEPILDYLPNLRIHSLLLSKSMAPVADHLSTLLVTFHSLSWEGAEPGGDAHQAATCEAHLRTEDLVSVGTRERKSRWREQVHS